jgi:hypothetical protein
MQTMPVPEVRHGINPPKNRPRHRAPLLEHTATYVLVCSRFVPGHRQRLLESQFIEDDYAVSVSDATPATSGRIAPNAVYTLFFK